MGAPTMDVLPRDIGQDLPHVVRRNLVELGIATNQIALALNQASEWEQQQDAVEDATRALIREDSQVARMADRLSRLAGDYRDRLIVAYALESTRYAVYTAQVAVDLAAHRQPAIHDITEVLPSTVARDVDTYLPPVKLTSRFLRADIIESQNRAVAEARSAVVNLSRRLIAVGDITEYDLLAEPRRPSGSTDVMDDLPAALHVYAGRLSWAIGVVTGNDPDAD